MIRSFLIALALTPVFAASQNFKIEKYRLPNGLTVILHEDHSQPFAAVNLWYKVGSKDEADKRSGFAHLFEHLMFMGTKRVPNGQFDILMEKYGGSNNASTTEDRTNYYSSGPSTILPTLLWLEADRLQGLALDMDQKKLDLQREVVKNERRQNVEDSPYGKAYDSINALLYPAGHPYHTTAIGSMEDLDNAKLNDVIGFFNTYYVPNNASLVVAGDFESKTIKPMISRLFGVLPRANDIVRKSVAPYKLSSVKRRTLVDKVESSKTLMVWQSPATFKAGDIEMRLTGGVLANGFTSRLYQELVVNRSLASEVSAYQNSLQLGSMFVVDATARPGVSLPKLDQAIDEILAKYKQTGPTTEELSRQVAKIGFQSTSALQSIADRADKINEYEFYFGNPNSFEKELALYRGATPARVKEVAAATLDPNRRVILHVIPQTTNGQDVGAQPANLKERPFTFPQPTEFRLANGVTVRYWQRTTLPMTTIAVRFRSGAAQDPATAAGLTQLSADLADEGAGDLDADQFTNAIDRLGAQVFTGADQFGTTFSLSCLTPMFGQALPLFSKVLTQPRFQPEDWARVKSLQIDFLKNDAADPTSVANHVANRFFFGDSNALSRSVDGTVESVSKLTLTQVKANARAKFVPANASIYAIGNLDPTRFKTLLQKNLGGWKGGKAPVGAAQFDEPRSEKQRLIIVDRPGSVQTVIRIMMPTEKFSSPNRYSIQELAFVLGGTFTSRINHNLREVKGYTYQASLGAAFNPRVTYLRLQTSVRTDVTGDSLKEIKFELDQAATGDITAEEAAKARSGITVGTMEAIGTQQGLISTAVGFMDLGLPPAKIGEEMSKFNNVQLESINDLAKNHALDYNRAVIVLVGDRAAIEKQIVGLGLPSPEIVKS